MTDYVKRVDDDLEGWRRKAGVFELMATSNALCSVRATRTIRGSLEATVSTLSRSTVAIWQASLECAWLLP